MNEEQRDAEKERLLAIEAKQVQEATRINEFLDDPVILDLLRRIEKSYLAEFDLADTDDKRTNVWAKMRAIKDFVASMRGVQESGKLAKHQRDIREAAEARTAQRTTRR